MTRPIHVEESVTIQRSPEAVWATVADYSQDERWRKGLLEMTPDPPGPPALGTQVHEVVKNGGREYVADATVTELGPMSYRFAGNGTLGELRGGREVVGTDQSSEAAFTYAIEITPTGLNRLLRPVMKSVMRRGLRADLERLRANLETSAAD